MVLTLKRDENDNFHPFSFLSHSEVVLSQFNDFYLSIKEARGETLYFDKFIKLLKVVGIF